LQIVIVNPFVMNNKTQIISKFFVLFFIAKAPKCTIVQWAKLGLDTDGEAAGDFSGWAISLDSAAIHLAIGDYRNDGNGASSGHTRVYHCKNTTWVQIGLDFDGENSGDESRISVELNADGNWSSS
jgi:hypothetical protein